MNAQERLSVARSQLVLRYPFFAVLSLGLDLKEDATCNTAYTDGKVIGYNPAYVEGLTDDEVIFLLAHEGLHPALAHHVRRGNRDPKQWNIAADYAINIPLVDEGLPLPEGGLFDNKYRGWSAEKIFADLFEGSEDPDEPEDSSDSEQPEGAGNDDESQCDGEGQDTGGSGDQPASPDSNIFGDDDPAPFGGEVRDLTGEDGESPATEVEKQKSEQEWKRKAVAAAQRAEKAGKGSASMRDFIEELKEPSANWRDILSKFMDETSKNDYSWSMPNRRFISQGIYMPSLHSEDLGEIVVAVDTSGSIDEDALAEFGGELSSILEEFDSVTVHTVYCDWDVTKTETVTHEDLPLEFRPEGGGGTDFQPVMDWVEENDINPACMIYFTDLYASMPEEPDYPVLWAVQPGGRTRDADFGWTIQLED